MAEDVGDWRALGGADLAEDRAQQTESERFTRRYGDAVLCGRCTLDEDVTARLAVYYVIPMADEVFDQAVARQIAGESSRHCEFVREEQLDTGRLG